MNMFSYCLAVSTTDDDNEYTRVCIAYKIETAISNVYQFLSLTDLLFQSCLLLSVSLSFNYLFAGAKVTKREVLRSGKIELKNYFIGMVKSQCMAIRIRFDDSLCSPPPPTFLSFSLFPSYSELFTYCIFDSFRRKTQSRLCTNLNGINKIRFRKRTSMKRSRQ